MPRARKRSRKQPSPSTLKSYGEKRDFARTPEPGPERPAAATGPLTFVVQKHAARQLHYDFRLELDGVLKSWSVPKGPSFDVREKRLAVMVEDHPLDYGSFEGVIPKGEYGGGQVIVWDNGTYSPDEGGELSFHDRAAAEERMRSEIEAGKLSITLRGGKLKGSWTLVKMQRGENDWLLIKHRDGVADAERDVLAEDRSVLSALSIDDLKSGRLPDQVGHGAVALRPADAVKRHRSVSGCGPECQHLLPCPGDRGASARAACGGESGYLQCGRRRQHPPGRPPLACAQDRALQGNGEFAA